jgi:uncharacterized membrane protein
MHVRTPYCCFTLFFMGEQLDDGLADALEAELARLHGELSASALRIRSVKDELQETQEELARVKEAHHRLRDTVGCDRV